MASTYRPYLQFFFAYYSYQKYELAGALEPRDIEREAVLLKADHGKRVALNNQSYNPATPQTAKPRLCVADQLVSLRDNT